MRDCSRNNMQIDRRLIESNLPKKGFIEEDATHKYYYHEYKGKRTGAYTYTSRGSNYKTYGDSLIKLMKKYLKLDSSKQVLDLCQCPLSGDEYNTILKNKGLITE